MRRCGEHERPHPLGVPLRVPFRIRNGSSNPDSRVAFSVTDVSASSKSDVTLAPVDRALCAYAEKLTLDPASMRAADVEELRRHGLDDAAIHEAIQVVAYFNYINRVADAMHVDLEPGMPPYPAP